jgi:hypothetical protein
MRTFTFRSKLMDMFVGFISLRQVLLTCMYTCAAFSFILISPFEGLTNLHPLLD